MGYTGRCFAVMSRFFRIAGVYQSPGIDKDLAANLLCQNQAVLLHRAGLGRFYAVLQVQVSRMLRTDPISAPPEHANAFPGII